MTLTREELERIAAQDSWTALERRMARDMLLLLDVAEAAEKFRTNQYRWSHSKAANQSYGKICYALDALHAAKGQ